MNLWTDTPPWLGMLAAASAFALPLSHAAAAAFAGLVLRRGGNAGPETAWRGAHAAALLALASAVVTLCLAVVMPQWQLAAGLLRLDRVGAAMALLVAFVGWVIVRYSRTYLRGEAGETAYAGWLAATLAAVMVVVVANHLAVLALAWSAASLALHRLLTFFAGRPAALAAAHKKYAFGRLADLCMLAAVLMLLAATGTLRLDEFAAAAAGGLPPLAQGAVVLIALACLLKCAQLPFHGWLIQVMEAPTPVSALLHAGIVNLGGFVLLRTAPLVAEVPLAQGLLVVAGSLTAVVAALVMSTRISIKVQLAWSTCAQMGFMLVQCGLGLWEMALLHLLAHSLYKAHAFLSAGDTVRQSSIERLSAPAVAPRGAAVVQALALGLFATAAAAWAWAAAAQALGLPGAGLSPALVVMAGVVALALTPLLRPAPGPAGMAMVWRAAAAGFAVAALYFALHTALAGWVVQAVPAPGTPWWLWVALAFGTLFLLQAVLALRPSGELSRRLYPSFYGGLFMDERVSLVLFRHWPPPPPRRTADTLVLQPASFESAP